MFKKFAIYSFLSMFLFTISWVSFSALLARTQSIIKIAIVSAMICLFFLGLYYLALKYVETLNKTKFNLLVGFIFTFFIGFATIIGCYTMTYPVSDLEIICSAVKTWVENGEILAYSGYFTVCSNTLGNTIFLYIVFKFLSYFNLYMGSDTAECVVIFVNVLMMAFAVFCVYRISCRLLKSQAQQLLFLLLNISFAPFYFWAHRYYSDTLSMPFVPLAILLYLRAVETNTLLKKVLYSISIGVCLWVGYFIKGSVLIALPAIIIFAVFTIKPMQLLKIIVPVILSIIFCFYSWEVYRNHNNWIDYQNEDLNKYPTTMWLLYGAHGNGNYADEDVSYLKTLPNYQQRAVAAKQLLKEYYSVYTPTSYFKFLTKKFAFTWSDPKYSAQNYIIASRHGNWIHYFFMEGAPFYALTNYYLNGWHYAFLAMLILSTTLSFKSPKWDISLLFKICLFGLILFLCFWETKPRYLFSFTPFFPLFFTQGLICVYSIIKKVLTFIFKIKVKN